MLTATIVALLTLPCSHAVGHVVAADLSSNERPYLGFSLEDLSFWDRASNAKYGVNGKCDHQSDCCKGDRSCANEKSCVAKGCCWDPHGPSNWCSGGSGNACNTTQDCSNHGTCTHPSHECKCDSGYQGDHCEFMVPKNVHIIQSCHLDVGFDGSIKQVLSEYFTQYIPKAIAVAKEMRGDATLPPGWRSNFMLQSYYVSLYLDCPPNIGLPCPTSEEVAALKAAAAAGDVHWHAFPHNAELEMGDPTLLASAINMTHALDASLGLPPKRVLSQRDVPGMSRAAIPLLKRAGVHAVSVGVNTASMYPRVPKIFRWQDPASNEEVYAMWHGRGYGGYSVSEAVEVAGLDHVMVTAWNGDNQGPSTSAELVKQFKAIAKEFPGAAVFASSFDNFTSLLDAVNESIPVLTQEIGDTWIYGTPSDPVKQATMRASMRAWSQYNAAGGAKDAVYLNATRLLVKSIEHTWGDHVELGAWQLASSWTNKQFESDRHSSTHEASQTFQFLESTWWEQRQFCTEYAGDTLAAAKHPLWEQYLEPELAAVNKPVVAPTPIAAGSGFVSFDPESAGPIKSGGISINFDSASGAISYLVDQHGRSWASADRTLLSMNYQTYNISQFQQFQRAYSNLTNPPSYFPHDFGKPNDTEAVYNNANAVATGFWQKKNGGSTTVLIESKFADATLAENYGAPSTIWTQLDLPTTAASNGEIAVTVLLLNKTATRHAEAMFLQLTPPSAATMEMDKLGTWIELEHGLVVDGGNKHMHGVNSGVRFNQSAASSIDKHAAAAGGDGGADAGAGGSSTMMVSTLDAGVVVFGKPTGFPTLGQYGNDEPDLDQGVSSMLLNNLWGTNYVMWYPFESNGKAVKGMENLRFRYAFQFK